MRGNAFGRAIAMFALVAAAMGDSMKLAAIGPYKSRGHGEGCRGNKHAKSNFKQNKRRGL